MNLDPDKAVFSDRFAHHLFDSSSIMLRMNESEAKESIRTTLDDAGDGAIRDSVIRMEGGKEYSAIDPCRTAPAQEIVQGRVGIPRPGQAIASPRVAMTVDDHPKLLRASSGP